MSSRERDREPRRLIRFRDLQERGILQNRMALKRACDDYGFPRGFYVGANSRAWFEDEIEAWLASRPTDRKAMQAEITA